MIMADKLARERKKLGLSQEALAERLNVSRQAVSKWESAQSVPDIEKLLKLAELFGVSTDYLLKDEMDAVQYSDSGDDAGSVRKVTLEEANDFLGIKASSAKRIALATMLCVLSPIALLILAACSENPASGITETVAAAAGLAALFLFVAPAVAIFILTGAKTAPYKFLEDEEFTLSYGVPGMVEKRREEYRQTHTLLNTSAACICVLAAVPIIVTGFLTENGLHMMLALSLTMLLAGTGAAMFIVSGVNWASFDKLLAEGDYSAENKRAAAIASSVSSVYWMVVTAGYLAVSFITEAWDRTWIIWAVAGVLYGAVSAIAGAVAKNRKGK